MPAAHAGEPSAIVSVRQACFQNHCACKTKWCMKIKINQNKYDRQTAYRALLFAFLFCQLAIGGYGQDGNAAIQDANQKVRSYFQTGTQLMYAIGAILGLIGAIKVYSKWNAGDHDTGKVAAAWFGSCVFLVVVVTVIKAFFGI